MVVTEPTFLSSREVSSNCFNGGSVHLPWVARVHELSWLPGTLLSLASEIHADPLREITWEDFRGAHLEISEIEHAHILFVYTSAFDYLHFLLGSVFEFLLFPPSELAGLYFAS